MDIINVLVFFLIFMVMSLCATWTVQSYKDGEYYSMGFFFGMMILNIVAVIMTIIKYFYLEV